MKKKRNEIAELRHRLDWTQEKMGDWLGVTGAQISHLELGKSKPSGPLQKMIRKLYDHLDQVA